MNRTQKIWLGVLTISPVFLFIAYFIFIFSFIISIIGNTARLSQTAGAPDALAISTTFISAFAIVGLLSLVSLGLMVYYIIHAVNNKAIESSERTAWILIFIFVGIIGFPIYWYLKIWKAPVGN